MPRLTHSGLCVAISEMRHICTYAWSGCWLIWKTLCMYDTMYILLCVFGCVRACMHHHSPLRSITIAETSITQITACIQWSAFYVPRVVGLNVSLHNKTLIRLMAMTHFFCRNRSHPLLLDTPLLFHLCNWWNSRICARTNAHRVKICLAAVQDYDTAAEPKTKKPLVKQSEQEEVSHVVEHYKRTSLEKAALNKDHHSVHIDLERNMKTSSDQNVSHSSV